MYWDSVRDTLAYNIPPLGEATGEGLNNILQQLITREMQAWVLYDRSESDETRMLGIVITGFVTDIGTLARSLLIYSVFGYAFVPDGVWKGALDILKDFANKNGCYKLAAYTCVPRVVEIVKMLGGKTNYTYLEFDLGD